jgi:hypothetical protein
MAGTYGAGGCRNSGAGGLGTVVGFGAHSPLDAVDSFGGNSAGPTGTFPVAFGDPGSGFQLAITDGQACPLPNHAVGIGDRVAESGGGAVL